MGAQSLKSSLRLPLLILLLLSLFAAPLSAQAQGQMQLLAYGLRTDAFPSLSFFLEAYDPQGNFLTGIQPAEIILSEDDAPRAVSAVEEIEPGIEFTLAFNPTRDLARRFGETTQFEQIRQTLLDWTGQQQARGASTFSLSTEGGLQLIRARQPAEFSGALSAYQPVLERLTVPTLFPLVQAVNLAADQVNDPTIKRAVLFVTPPLKGDQLNGLEDLTARAVQLRVRVFVWVAVPSLDGAAPDTAALQRLTDATGGKLVLIAGQETFPSLEEWLTPLRRVYQVRFLSGVRASGTHRLAIALNRPGMESLPPAALTYAIEIAPPNPIFLSPPTQIERRWTQETAQQASQLTPQTVSLQALMEFPDGHSRGLRFSRLYVDGTLVDENTAPPFDQFEWNLAAFSTSRTAYLQLEVEDELGLTAKSILLPVEVLVEEPPRRTLWERISYRGVIAMGAVLLAALVLVMVLLGESRARRQRSPRLRRSLSDPLTQPVSILQEAARPVQERAKPLARMGFETPPVPAYLVRLGEDGEALPGTVVPLSRSELTLGSDPRAAMVIVDDPSVSGLHARLVQEEEGKYRLFDAGSQAGTWVNFQPVPPEGVPLQHEDCIHLGRVMYRFDCTEPEKKREWHIQPVQGD